MGFLRALESSSLCVGLMYPRNVPGANWFTSSMPPWVIRGCILLAVLESLPLAVDSGADIC
jgi:hypothetical protein